MGSGIVDVQFVHGLFLRRLRIYRHLLHEACPSLELRTNNIADFWVVTPSCFDTFALILSVPNNPGGTSKQKCFRYERQKNANRQVFSRFPPAWTWLSVVHRLSSDQEQHGAPVACVSVHA